MDEISVLCSRLAGDGEGSARIAEHAQELDGERVRRLAFAVRACREHGAPPPLQPGADMRSALAAEVSAASARLPDQKREALALRELLGLSHAELGSVLELDADAVAPLLGQARISLRAELRGTPAPPGVCVEHERALRTATARQDGEAVSEADEDWLLWHLGHCQECARAHAAMLEGSACYRGWAA
jgi:hypothetical protein